MHMVERHESASFTTYFRRSRADGDQVIRRGSKGTKIIATIGPACEDEAILRRIMTAGMNVARFNMSHGSLEDHQRRFDLVRRLSHELNRPIGILADIQGPKIRISLMPDGGVPWPDGHEAVITVDPVPMGSAERVGISYPELARDAQPGNIILIDDGRIRTEVTKVTGNDVHIKVINGGTLKSRKGVNLPDMNTSAPALTDKDKEDLKWALKVGVDFIALSFVRSEIDVRMLKRRIEDAGLSTPVIAKIERPEAVDNIESILSVADGIMVARGDLGIEISTERLPVVQKHLITRANAHGRMVITATQMLETMVDNPIPTRAETSDIANAIFDGSGAVMLSGETAAGKYPLEAVQEMCRIAIEAEASPYMPKLVVDETLSRTDDVSRSICRAAADIALGTNAGGIMVFSHDMRKAMVLSKLRPLSAVVCLCYDDATWRSLSLLWGIVPLRVDFTEDQQDLLDAGISESCRHELYHSGDQLVAVMGMAGEGANAIKLVRA